MRTYVNVVLYYFTFETNDKLSHLENDFKHSSMERFTIIFLKIQNISCELTVNFVISNH